MAYRQYTSCIKRENYVGIGFTGYGPVIVLLGAVASGLIVAATSYVVIPVIIGLISILIAFCIWWLYGRLICLGGERCAIGVVTWFKGPGPIRGWEKAGDDDRNLNIVLAPGPLNFEPPDPLTGDDKVHIELGEISDYTSSLQGELIEKNDIIGDRYYVSKHRKHLHCEFEGSGVRNLLASLSVLLATLILALVVGPAFYWIFVFLAIFFAGFTFMIFDTPLNPGEFDDVDPGLTGNLDIGVIVVIKGDWIYDSFHEGHNELHPVKACQIIGKMVNIESYMEWEWPATDPDSPDLSTDESTQAAIDLWCNALKAADDAENGGSHDKPENHWTIHPLIDGCKVSPVIL